MPFHKIPISSLKGVGAGMTDKLAKLDIHNCQDILFHLPIRYQNRTQTTPILQLLPESEAVIQGLIISSEVIMGRRRSLLCKIKDETGVIGLRFYHFSEIKKNDLQPRVEVRCFGKPRQGASGLEFYHPEYQIITLDDPIETEKTLTPIYPLTEGLTQQRIRSLCEQVLTMLDKQESQLQELLPATVRNRLQLGSLAEAVRILHCPPAELLDSLSAINLHHFQRRLAFEELLAHNLSMQQARHQVRSVAGFSMPASHTTTIDFKKQLPFALTGAQKRVLKEIYNDMTDSAPMLRLVQGDVGSGKTVVAALAALKAVENNFQAAIMAPTEILAEQHEHNFRAWLIPLGITIAYLSGKTKGKKRKEELEKIASGEAVVIIGTHALFQDDVHFHKLGLTIIDEQHRFGVHQRLALLEKSEHAGGHPDQLIMTATPIPRTLAMTAYADLDCSIIDELPAGRTSVNTVVISDDRRNDVIKRLRTACLEGRQAYWVCTLIEDSDSLQCQAAVATAKKLEDTLTELSIGLIHGRMTASKKAEVMDAFKEGHLHLLVATTVIEVGVDVPNASLMIIENPERLGLSQLHQLRGRVGRGNIASHCLLMYHSPLSTPSKERLLVMRNSSDGFVIAEKDLEIRGPGEVMGTKQTGLAQFKVTELERDSDLLNDVKLTAQQLLHESPEHIEPLIERWLGRSDQYLNV